VSVAGEKLRPLHLEQVADGFRAQYELFIDTWAGRTTINLADGKDTARRVLNIRPHGHKLSADEFDAMLTELSELSSALPWGLSPGAAQGDISHSTPPVTHPAVIESQLPRLERLLARLLDDPPTLTERVREARPLDASRRIDLKTMRWLAARPSALAAVRGAAQPGSTFDWRSRIDQGTPRQSYDHPLTCYILHLIRRVRRRLMLTVRELRRAGRRFSDEAADVYADELAHSVEDAITRLDATLHAPLFRGLTPTPLSNTALQAITDNPLYAALHRTVVHLLDPGLAFAPGGELLSALKRTYDLFELLVLHRLAAALRNWLGGEWAWSQPALNTTGREVRPADGAVWCAHHPSGRRVELRYQQQFGRAKAPPDVRTFGSLSGALIPDYLLVIAQGDSVKSWLILDAKYRSSRQSVDEGLGDVHRYRDALRLSGIPAAGGYVIVPRLAEPNAIYAQPDFIAHHSFGVCELFADDPLAPIRRWVNDMASLPSA
jgi:hypothetical protein